MSKLSFAKIKSLAPGERVTRYADGAGLSLFVQPNGAKLWRFRYRFGGRASMLSLGAWPEISIVDARGARDAARAKLRGGINPSDVRKGERAERVESVRSASSENSFELVAAEWLEKRTKKLTPQTLAKAEWMLQTYVYPHIGSRAIADIEPPDVLALLQRIEARKKYETAHRTKSRCSQIFRYAVATGRAKRDPTLDLRDALTPVDVKSHAALTDPRAIGALLVKLDTYTGSPATVAALQLAPLLFVRPGDLRAAEWSEIDFDAAEWRIPAERMKMRNAHIVPLARQAIDVFRGLQAHTSDSRFVFCGAQNYERPMSENTVNDALRRIGYRTDEMTGHGFRTLASTRLNELGYAPDVIERQLAHKPRNKVRATYNHAEYLAERRKMMQEWADYLDMLRESARKKAASA